MLEKDIKKVLVSHDEIVEAAKKLGEKSTKGKIQFLLEF